MKWRKPKQRRAPWTTMKSQAHRLTPGKPRKPVRAVSKRRQATSAEYRRLSRAFLDAERRAGKTCEIVDTIPELRDGQKYGHAISNRLAHTHHVFGRQGVLLTWVPGFKAVSAQGHRWIDANREAARAHGWLAPKGQWCNPVPGMTAGVLREMALECKL